MMVAIRQQEQQHALELSPRSYDMKEMPASHNQSKYDPKNISGGPFNAPPRSDYSAAQSREVGMPD